MKRLLVIVFIMMGLGMCFTSLTYFNASRLTFVSEQFCRIATLGKVKDSFYYLTQDFQDSILLSDYHDYLLQSPFGNYKTVNWTLKHKNQENGLLKGNIISTEGKNFRVEILLKRENKRWKIDNLIDSNYDIRLELERLRKQKERDKLSR